MSQIVHSFAQIKGKLVCMSSQILLLVMANSLIDYEPDAVSLRSVRHFDVEWCDFKP